MLVKEFIQLKRDRVSFAMIIMIPLMQLLLFGYAINTNSAPSADRGAAAGAERSSAARSSRRSRTPSISRSRTTCATEAEFDRLLASGTVLFAIEIPANFERAVRRGDRPAILVAADATDPVASGSALAALGGVRADRARATTARVPDSAPPPFEIRTHARYNPAADTSLNIVPGLVGTILTMTMLIFTALSVTREIERGTMESLLSMPITPVEIMLGKIVPYVMVGFVQAALIIGVGILLFGVPLLGSLALLALLSTLFITTNLVDRLHVLDPGAEPAAGDADVDDVLPAEHPAVRLHVSVRRHAGWAQWIGEAPAAHALSAHRARDHAQGRDARRPAFRHARARRADAARHDDRGHALPPHAGLRFLIRAHFPRKAIQVDLCVP